MSQINNHNNSNELNWQIRGNCWIRFKIETNLAVQCFRRYTWASSGSNQAPFSSLGEDDSTNGILLVAVDWAVRVLLGICPPGDTALNLLAYNSHYLHQF